MEIILACEESQAVCIEMRKRGHNAFSCDTAPCTGGHPEWHIQDDIKNHLNDGWDLMIAFPPCTHLAVSGASWFKIKQADGRQQKAIDFFLSLANAPIEQVGIENPIGIMSSEFRPPDQIIQPYYFGDPHRKATCLWLKNLPLLKHYSEDDLFYSKTHVDPEIITMKSKQTGRVRSYSKWEYNCATKIDPNQRGSERSKTFPGIARAMAEQWTPNNKRKY